MKHGLIWVFLSTFSRKCWEYSRFTSHKVLYPRPILKCQTVKSSMLPQFRMQVDTGEHSDVSLLDQMWKMHCSYEKLLASSWTWQCRATVSYCGCRNKWKCMRFGFPDASLFDPFELIFILPLLDLIKPRQMSLCGYSLLTCGWHIPYQVAQGFYSFMPGWIEFSLCRPTVISPFWYWMLKLIKEGLQLCLVWI